MPLLLTFYLIENALALANRHTQLDVDPFYGNSNFKIIFGTGLDILKRII